MNPSPFSREGIFAREGIDIGEVLIPLPAGYSDPVAV